MSSIGGKNYDGGINYALRAGNRTETGLPAIPGKRSFSGKAGSLP